MARLVGSRPAEVQRRRLETARAFAAETGAVVVLKGQRTLVARAGRPRGREPDRQPGHGHRRHGRRAGRDRRGAARARPRRAGRPPPPASSCTARPGDLAAARLGQESLLAGDLLDALPEAHPRPARREHAIRSVAHALRGRDRGSWPRTLAARLPRRRGRAALAASWARARPRSCAGWRAAWASDPGGGREPDLRAAHRPTRAGSRSTTPTSTGWRATATSGELGLEELPGPARRAGRGVGGAAVASCRGRARSACAWSTRASDTRRDHDRGGGAVKARGRCGLRLLLAALALPRRRRPPPPARARRRAPGTA